MSTEGTFQQAVDDTCCMAQWGSALAQTAGLSIVSVSWEDTARNKGSCWGPNISDMTLRVKGAPLCRLGSTCPHLDIAEHQLAMSHAPRRISRCLPILRFPNFADVTCDVRPEDFYLRVGNHVPDHGKEDLDLDSITLAQLLRNPAQYCGMPELFAGSSLYHERDTHVLASAQACFLPVLPQGKTEFSPNLFNYQSTPDNPAVLAILATREGTSVRVVDNGDDTEDGGQALYFNNGGRKTPFVGERKTAFVQSIRATAVGKSAEEKKKIEAKAVMTEARQDMNLVLLIQVPLKQPDVVAQGMEVGGGTWPPPAADAPSFTVALVGDRGVGKTTFLRRHITGEFEKQHIRTLAPEEHTLCFFTSCGTVTLRVLEIPPDQLDAASLSSADAVLVMFSLDSPSSHASVPNYRALIQQALPDVPVCAVGNKVDLKTTAHLGDFSVSSKSNYNFEKPFVHLVRILCGEEALEFVSCPALAPPEISIDPALMAQYEQELMMANMMPLPDDDDDDFGAAPARSRRPQPAGPSDLESVVIGHGEDLGEYTEGRASAPALVRDERYPIRVTVQFYQATSNGVVEQADMHAMAAQLRRVYDNAEYTGSLVVGGPTDRRTEVTTESSMQWVAGDEL